MRLLRLSTVLVSLLLAASLPAVTLLEMTALLANPDQYDKQAVRVTGQVTGIQTASNREGESAYGFLLKSAHGSIKVTGLGRALVREGEQVIVEGILSRQRRRKKWIDPQTKLPPWP
ncbi:MAG: cytochrome c maturation protein CcmE, partial [Nitrospira sp.]